MFRVGPGDVGLGEIPVLDPGPRHGTHGLGLVIPGIAHPGHAVAGLVADDAADVVEERLFVHGSHQDLVAVADGPQFAVQTAQRVLRPFALRGVMHDRTAHHKIAMRVLDGGGVQSHRQNRAVLAHHLKIKIVDEASFLEPGKFAEEYFAALRGHQLQKFHLSHHRLPRVTEPGQFRVVDPHEGAGRIQGVVAAGRMIVEILDFFHRFTDGGGHLVKPRHQMRNLIASS